MLRKVHLKGILEEKFGGTHTVSAKNIKDALNCIDVNRPGFRSFFIANPDLEFEIFAAGEQLDEKTLAYPISRGDIIIEPVIGGGKSGGAKILTAIAIGALMIGTGMWMTGGGPFFTGALGEGAAVGLTWAGTIAAGVAVNLALAGIAQIMAPDPSTDEENKQGYLFTGSKQGILRGAPVPLLYGELRVPGTPISYSVGGTPDAPESTNTFPDSNGNIYAIGSGT